MKHRKNFWKTFLAVGSLMILLVLCAAIPQMLFNQFDENTYETIIPLQRKEGKVSAEAEDIFFVRFLHQRNSEQKQASYKTNLQPAEKASADTVLKDFYRLLENDVISVQTYATLKESFAGGAEVTSTEDSSGVVKIYCVFSDNTSLTYEKELITGNILRCWNSISFLETFDKAMADSFISKYIAYLGLSNLQDFAPSKSIYLAASFSESGQLLMYNNGELFFGIASVV